MTPKRRLNILLADDIFYDFQLPAEPSRIHSLTLEKRILDSCAIDPAQISSTREFPFAIQNVRSEL